MMGAARRGKPSRDPYGARLRYQVMQAGVVVLLMVGALISFVSATGAL